MTKLFQHHARIQKIYHFSRFQRGSNIFQGGSNCLFPIETHVTCDFPGGVRTPSPPLDPHLNTLFKLSLGLLFLFLGYSLTRK